MTQRKKKERRGHLFIIGGAEDRENDKIVLSRLVELTGGGDPRIVVLTSASSYHDEVWAIYEGAFCALGAKRCEHLTITTREQANDDAMAQRVYEADIIFMTGGDQKKLVSLIGGTRIDRAMHMALRELGACIAGTSAGASAMSEHMLYDAGSIDGTVATADVRIAAGLGFMRRVVIDQHFSERKRLGRLLAVVAQNPYLLGCGIDEDTALVVEPGLGLEVVGDGSVTLLDGREMLSSVVEEEPDKPEKRRLELTNVKLHLLPAGACYYFDGADGHAQTQSSDGRTVPIALYDVVAAVASTPDAAMAAPLAAAA